MARNLERRVQALATCSRTTVGHPAQVLAQWLHRYESELFEFIRTPQVSPTNNLADCRRYASVSPLSCFAIALGSK